MRELYTFKQQDAFDFANYVGARTFVKGDELFFRECPYCHGRGKANEKSFSINLRTGQFKCFRESCGMTGNMVILAKDFDFSLGTQVDEYYKPRKQYRTFTKPKEPIKPKPEAIQYLESRGISERVANEYQITVQNDHPNILVFPFLDEQGNLVSVKYRKTDYDKTKDNNKEWFEKNTKPILFGMYQCDINRLNRAMILTEGQLDALSVAEAGINNAVSVPTGAKGFTWIPYCWDWIHKNFGTIIVFGDYEKGHMSLLDDVKLRFKTLKIKHVRYEDYKDCKDANEILQKYGKEQIKACIDNAELVPVSDVVNLADVEDVDIFKLEKLKTGISQLDRLLYGGLPFGGVHLITGKAGHGKLLADNTPVFTRNGWKTHGEIVVGDEVIGRYGKFVRVKRVFPKSYANMKVVFNNNEVIYCHENHEWVTDFHSGNGYKERLLETREIKKWLENVKYHPARLIKREPLDGVDENIYVKPYTLGAWLGDGRTDHPDVATAKTDYCVVERIIADGYGISWQTVHKDTKVIYTGFCELRKQLRKYDMCVSRKAKEKYIPHCYLVASIKTRLDLLAGLLDTDGYYNKDKGCYVYSTTGEKLRDTFIDLIHTFGWNCWVSRERATISSSGIVGKKDVFNIGFVPVGLKIPCVVARKKQTNIKPYSKRRVAIKEIIPCDNIRGNCIEVEGGVYCVGKTMIPTHNSTFASQIVVNAREQGYKCFCYSGELPNYLFKAWMSFQVAGQHCFEYQNEWGDRNYNISATNKQIISDWYRDYIWLYDASMLDDVEHVGLVKTAEKMILQYGCKVILLDNLMTALDLEDVSGYDKYDKQSMFVKKLAQLARQYNVLILLVAHKRKNNFSANINDEVAGSSDVTNLGMITLSYEKGEDMDADSRLLKISKNRLFGKTNTVGWELFYDERSKRIFGQGDNVKQDFSCFRKIDADGFEEIDVNLDNPFW